VILAGDVGGTKTHLALFEASSSPRKPVCEEKFPSRDFPSLSALAQDFLASQKADVERAVFGVAGPVVDNRSDATNLAWKISADRLGDALDAPVELLNDLEATAWALPLLEASDIERLDHDGGAIPGNRALIAAGTGLGEAMVIDAGDHLLPIASEGGHADFAPRDALEDELLVWLRAKHGRVSYERILSGAGIANLYRFMTDTGRGNEPPEVAARFAEAPDPAVVVTETALDGSCERSLLTVRKFVEIYGAEAGNLALKALAVGGVYLTGGIAPRLLPIFREPHFMNGFTIKGRLSPMLEGIPVALVKDPQVALWGAAACALDEE